MQELARNCLELLPKRPFIHKPVNIRVENSMQKDKVTEVPAIREIIEKWEAEIASSCAQNRNPP